MAVTKAETISRVLLVGGAAGAMAGVGVAVGMGWDARTRYAVAIVGVLLGATLLYLVAKRFEFIDGKRSPGKWIVESPAAVGATAAFTVFAYLASIYRMLASREDVSLRAIGILGLVALAAGIGAFFLTRWGNRQDALAGVRTGDDAPRL